MTRIAWLTDIHLDHLTDEQICRFGRSVESLSPDMCLITGDVSTARDLERDLSTFQSAIGGIPMRAVAGNHDCYGASIADTRYALAGYRWWLQCLAPIDLGNQTCLVGVDGWGDGRAGCYERSRVVMSDSSMIEEFRGRTRVEVGRILRHLGEESAELAGAKFRRAVELGYRHILFATHVPPFASCSLYDGKPSGPEHAAFFVNVALGQELLAISEEHRDVSITVLAGHTHHRADVQVATNLRVYVGHAEYGAPGIAGIVDVGPNGVEVEPQ